MMPEHKGKRSKTGSSINLHPVRTITGSGMAGVGRWAALAFVFNLVWEIAQVRLYTIWFAADGMTIAWALLHCTLGDVVIALAMFVLAGIALWRADWPVFRPWTGGAIVVIGALTYTAWSEWFNVYRAGNWDYTSSMPMIFGIGLSPLLQWLILPPMMVFVHRALSLHTVRSP